MIISAPRWSGRDASGAVELGLRLGSDMWQYWEALGYLREGYTWLDSLLSLDAPVATAVRRTALHSAAVLALRQGSYALANRLLEASLALAVTRATKVDRDCPEQFGARARFDWRL